MPDDKDERAAFTKWVEKTYSSNAEWDGGRNCFVEFPVHIAWQAWRERAAAPLPECGTSTMPVRLRDRDAIVMGGLLYCGPVMREAADLIEQLENDLGRFQESNRVAQETIADLREQLAEANRKLEVVMALHREREDDDRERILSTSGASVVAALERLKHLFGQGDPRDFGTNFDKARQCFVRAIDLEIEQVRSEIVSARQVRTDV